MQKQIIIEAEILTKIPLQKHYLKNLINRTIVFVRIVIMSSILIEQIERVNSVVENVIMNTYKNLDQGKQQNLYKNLLISEIVNSLTKENLEQAINDFKDLTNLGTYFNVTRTTIRNYLQKYGLYEKFKLKYDFHSKVVLQLNTHGELIKEWPSITDAAACIGTDTSSISKVCLGKRGSAGGFLWKYKE